MIHPWISINDKSLGDSLDGAIYLKVSRSVVWISQRCLRHLQTRDIRKKTKLRSGDASKDADVKKRAPQSTGYATLANFLELLCRIRDNWIEESNRGCTKTICS